MIASFAQANNVDLRSENNFALQRLGEGVLAGARDPSHFKARAGEKQDMTDLKVDGKYAWLEPGVRFITVSATRLIASSTCSRSTASGWAAT